MTRATRAVAARRGSHAPAARAVARASRTSAATRARVRDAALAWACGLALASGVALAGAGVGVNLAHASDRAAADVAAAGARDCTASLWGPTESDAADVAACVADALARSRP